ncbi:hypothetical protein RAC89_30730 [Paenibacillus sp. GD4]|uniref:hypothetical protein n=1 Tax=Paenibacillus sp. GD4 TaxID=3068890 RepID=UPI00279682C9|nr:hypothetical protein [Paenibacillus sp. GD4]MDQ1914761.1 hypothetical protein [Paenibacillus sp. GD4]
MLLEDNGNFKELPKGVELAQLLIYVAQGQYPYLKRERITGLTSDSISRLLKYIKEGDSSEGKIYKVTLLFILRVINLKNMTIGQFLSITTPEDFIISIFNENEVGCCLTPWCRSNGSKKKMKLVRDAKLGYFQFTHVHICLDCGVRYGRGTLDREWGEVENYNSFVYEIIRKEFNSGKKRSQIQKEFNLSQFILNKMLAFLLRHKLLENDLQRKYDYKFTEIDYEHKFVLLRSMDGRKITNAAGLFNWGHLEYFYYFFDPKIQEKIYEVSEKDLLSENQSFLQIKNRKTSALKQISSEECAEFWIRAKQYIIEHSTKNMNPRKQGFYDFLGRGFKWLKVNIPEILEWFHNQQILVEKQNTVQKELERKDKIIRTLILQYKRGMNSSMAKLVEESGVPKKYLRLHNLIPSIKIVMESLINGVYSIEWLENAVNRVGTDNRLLQLIEDKRGSRCNLY